MEIGKTPKNTKMDDDGYKAFVMWNDGSKSYYKDKKIALSEMRKEQVFNQLKKDKKVIENQIEDIAFINHMGKKEKAELWGLINAYVENQMRCKNEIWKM